MESKVFISHRSTDKEVAEMLLDFLAGQVSRKNKFSVPLCRAMILVVVFLLK